MECPFCAEEIKDEALVCRHCARDLKIPRPLLEENAELVVQLEQMRIENGTLRAELARRTSPVNYWVARLLRHVLPAAALLILVHFFVIVVFNLNPMLLRILSVVIPLPFGFALRFVSHHGMRAAVVVGIVTGIMAVAGMLTVIGVIDAIPIIPQTARDAREVAEYMVSIALAVVTGNILALAALRILPRSMSGRRKPNPLAIRIAVLTGAGSGRQALRRRAEKIEDILHTVGAAGAAVATAAGSVYTGVRALLPILPN